MNLVEALKKETNWIETENGMNCHISTTNNLLDIFSSLLSFRHKNEDEITQKFNKAYNEDPLLAMKLLFYARNVRGLGQGEKHFFRTVCHYLAIEHTEVMRKNLPFIYLFGRFDDYYAFVNTPLEKDSFDILYSFVKKDLKETNDNNLSLVGKWLKSINASSVETRKLGKITAKRFGMTIPEYRKVLSTLRKRIDVVERKLCSNNIEDINYEHVPSKAMSIYNTCFLNKDIERFNKYLEDVKEGKSKINSSTILPYEIFKKLGFYINYKTGRIVVNKNETLELQWKNLPNYIDESSDALVVADTSGSMLSEPMSIALSLAVYLSERNKGIWHNKFITFSSKPTFIELSGDTLFQKLNGIPSIVSNTNIEKVFDLILNAAVENNLKPEEMVKKIIVVSDMQFDAGVNKVKENFTNHLREKFNSKGYELPELIYWDASPFYSNTYHALAKDQNVALVSGASPSIYKQILSNEIKTPYETMLDILNDKIFDCVTI